MPAVLSATWSGRCGANRTHGWPAAAALLQPAALSLRAQYTIHARTAAHANPINVRPHGKPLLWLWF